MTFGSMAEVLRHHAASRPDACAYAFLADRGGESTLTYGELDRRARVVATDLIGFTRPGDRALLLFAPGLDALVAFFGCLYAGVVAVPVVPPRHDRMRDAVAGIVADCRPSLVLTTSSVAARVGVETAADVRCLLVDRLASRTIDPVPTRHHDLAMLQYTSGSTSAPKGVMVRHANLLANLEMARGAFGASTGSTYVCWVPLHHDMGLILNALASAYAGARCVLMAPVMFMQRPLGWLRAIADYRADIAGGPNFAFDLCARRFRADLAAGLDLSCWRVAFNGAEPVHADTIARFAALLSPYGFAPEATFPCYGMAEATVLISAPPRGAPPVTRAVSRRGIRERAIRPPGPAGDTRTLVGCGRVLPGEQLAIVDPADSGRAGPDAVGEIWVRGPHVAGGYWRKPEETTDTFQAEIAGESGGPWLRTGDLGWIDPSGELFIAGRLKDVIVIRGTNVYPQDVERTVQGSHEALRPDCGAAFGVEDEQGDEHLVVVQEVERGVRLPAELDDVVGAVRAAVVREHELTIQALVLIRAGTIAKTSSGKIQRRLTRQRWLAGALDVLHPRQHEHAPSMAGAAVAGGGEA